MMTINKQTHLIVTSVQVIRWSSSLIFNMYSNSQGTIHPHYEDTHVKPIHDRGEEMKGGG